MWMFMVLCLGVGVTGESLSKASAPQPWFGFGAAGGLVLVSELGVWYESRDDDGGTAEAAARGWLGEAGVLVAGISGE